MALGASAISEAASAEATLDINPAAVSTHAGSGTNATVNGTGTAASFTDMGGVAVTGGHAYLGTVGAIRRVNLATKETSILAGSPSSGRCVNATDPTAVRFGRIIDVTTDGTYIYSVGECPAPYYRQVRWRPSVGVNGSGRKLLGHATQQL